MSTRCNIYTYSTTDQPLHEPDFGVYRHSDGYPDGDNGVVDSLLDFLVEFKRDRGVDPEYQRARLVAHQARLMPGCLSLGVLVPPSPHGDEEYLYAVYPDRLVVMDGNWNHLETHAY